MGRRVGLSTHAVRCAVVSTAIVCLTAASSAIAHERRDDLRRVDPRIGPSLHTHGHDPPPPAAARLVSAFDEHSPQRPPLCAPAPHQQILYGRPEDASDRMADVRPEIRAAVRRMNAALNAESLASGGPTADLRTHCHADGEIAIGSFTSSGTDFAEIVSGARAAGYDSKQADYLIFFDGEYGDSCGIASFARDERLIEANESNDGGGYGVVYSGCWDGDTPLHESAHLMGAVQYGAPHSTGSGGHCFEELDLMCYAPDGGDLNQAATVSVCLDAVRFDCGFDDYFDSAPEPGEYLESHWNLGSPLNRALAFGGANVTSEGEPRWYRMRVRVPREAKRLEVTLRADTGVELYLRRGAKPTVDRHACRARRATCRLRDPRRGRWVAAALSSSPQTGPIRINARTERRSIGRASWR